MSTNELRALSALLAIGLYWVLFDGGKDLGGWTARGMVLSAAALFVFWLGALVLISVVASF